MPLDATAGTGRVAVALSRGRTVVTRAFAASPLKLLTPANHGHAAWVYSSTYGGGLVDGDRLSMHLTVAEGATLVLATQASTKVYRSPRGTSSELHATVGGDALCVVIPDPVTCFARARYRQEQRVDVAAGGALVLVDWVTSGRRAAGERWAFDAYASRTIVRAAGRLLVHDAIALHAADGDLAVRAGRFDVLATVLVIGPLLAEHAARIVAGEAGRAVQPRADHLASATAVGTTGCGGCVVRIAARSVEEAARHIRDLLAFLPPLLGDDPWTRKW